MKDEIIEKTHRMIEDIEERIERTTKAIAREVEEMKKELDTDDGTGYVAATFMSSYCERIAEMRCSLKALAEQKKMLEYLLK